MITIGELAEWIMKNRRDKAFYDYSLERIINELTRCAEELSMLCVTENGEITGVICCEKDPVNKVFFVHDVLTTKPGIIKKMAAFFRDNYPQYTYTGINRHGRKRKFNNINKVANRL